MKNKLTVLSFLFFLLSFQDSLQAQYGITLNSPDAMESYTTFKKGGTTYLIDNCGYVVNTWNASNGYNLTKILPNGNILYLTQLSIREKDWNDNTVNEVFHNDPSLRLSYEVVLLPSGNYLCVGRKDFSEDQFTGIGYDLSFTDPTEVDVVVELDRETGEIVWEWNIADHVIQERDANAPNYGPIVDNPQLLNMDAIATVDWTWTESFMINGMDYNPALDQIILSVRKMSEIVIIDHSTTTEEAAGSTGGNAGKGGDILYRWGNPENYGRGTSEDRILYFQHNPNWITEGEHTGKIICYNNGLDRPGVDFYSNYSTVPIIAPTMDNDGNYVLEAGAAYEPAVAPIEYSEVHTNTAFFSDYTSGAEVLPNGNIFITEGIDGRLLEINPAGELVWEYTVPQAYYLFRAEKYSLDYPAFEGKDLTPQGLVPNDISVYDCQLLGDTMTTSINPLVLSESAFSVIHQNTSDEILIQNTNNNTFDFSLIDIQGRVLKQQQKVTTNHQFSVHQLPRGFYVLKLVDNKTNKWTTTKIVLQ